MDHGLYWVLSSVVLIVGCVFLLLWVRKHNRESAAKDVQDLEARIMQEAEAKFRAELQATQSITTPPSKEAPVSIMEQRERKMSEAQSRGICMYCNLPAVHPYPTYKRVRSIFDPVLRWLGVKQLDRWRVAVSDHWFSSVKAEHALCTSHQQRVQGLMEEHLARGVRDIAKALNDQGLELYTYEVSGVHDVVMSDMRELRDPRKKGGRRGRERDQQVPDNVRLLKTGNGTTARPD